MSSEEAVSNAEYSVGQLTRISVIYENLARMLPTEGRDYRVVFEFPDKDDTTKMSFRMEPITTVGKLWCDYCMNAFRKAIHK